MYYVLSLFVYLLFGVFFIDLGSVIHEPYVCMAGVLSIYIGIISVGLRLLSDYRRSYYIRHI